MTLEFHPVFPLSCSRLSALISPLQFWICNRTALSAYPGRLGSVPFVRLLETGNGVNANRLPDPQSVLLWNT